MPNHLKNNPFTIAIFGEVLADIFPDDTVLGGAPYNVARHIRAFQHKPVVISRVGNDVLKDELMCELDRLDIDASGIQLDPIFPTGQVLVHIENGAHRFEIKPKQAYDHIHAGMTHLTTLATKPDLAYFGTLAQRNVESRLALDTFLSDAKCQRFLDINLRAPWYDKHMIRRSLLRTEIVKINEDELRIVTKMFDKSLSNDTNRAAYLMSKFNLKYLFVTCGENGAWSLNAKGDRTEVKTPPLEKPLVDTVGAGDAFAAICILGLLYAWPMELMLTRAAKFASALCTIRGAAPENIDFYTPYIENWFG
jgi:fructokinase